MICGALVTGFFLLCTVPLLYRIDRNLKEKEEGNHEMKHSFLLVVFVSLLKSNVNHMDFGLVIFTWK